MKEGTNGSELITHYFDDTERNVFVPLRTKYLSFPGFSLPLFDSNKPKTRSVIWFRILKVTDFLSLSHSFSLTPSLSPSLLLSANLHLLPLSNLFLSDPIRHKSKSLFVPALSPSSLSLPSLVIPSPPSVVFEWQENNKSLKSTGKSRDVTQYITSSSADSHNQLSGWQICLESKELINN